MTEKDYSQLAASLIGQLALTKQNHFLMTWEGSNIPRGAKIDDVEIGHTQNGMIVGVAGSGGGNLGKDLGVYERMDAESGQQAMIISTDGQSVIPPEGGSVQSIKLETPPLETGGPADDNSLFPAPTGRDRG